MNFRVINREKINMKIILVKKLKKTLCWMVNWITILYVLVVCIYRSYMRSLGRLMCNYLSVGLETAGYYKTHPM
jgi:hypothetical protein